MSSEEKEKAKLVENLLRQGTSREDLEKVYQSLRARGYGEEEARRRSGAAIERVRTQRDLNERRRETAARSKAAGRPVDGSVAPRGRAEGMTEEGAVGRRAVDWLPEVPLWLRRRINRYAYTNGFLITRLAERFDDFMCTFDRNRGDYASRGFLRLLAEERGWRGRSPLQLSLIDDLDALRESARRLLGRGPLLPRPGGRDTEAARGDEVAKFLRSREPFALEFLGIFMQQHDMLRRGLEHLGRGFRAGKRTLVSDLARVVKDGCRLIIASGSLERDKLETLLTVVREANLAAHPGERAAAEVAEAVTLFRTAYKNLQRYSHEMYPALLKMIASFYQEGDPNPAKRTRILDFLQLTEQEILTWEGWQRRMREMMENAMKERQEKELALLEQEKEENFSARFEGTLATLASLFPDSGIERIEQGEFVLPWFANRVFTRNSLFQTRAADLEYLASGDPMGLVIVLHSILDDLLFSLEPYTLEQILGVEGVAASIVGAREEWHEAYRRLFEPYLDEIRDYARESEGDPRFAKLFREGARARGIEEEVNQLRNRAIRHFGHVILERGRNDGPNLFELAARISVMLAHAGAVINQSTISAADPVRLQTMEALATNPIVDYETRSHPGSTEYRPITRQIRRWIEARFRESVRNIPQKAQVAFLDVLRGTAELYDSLLNSEQSFLARAGHGVILSSADDHDAWAREKGERGRDSFESLQATLKEEFPGQYVDALTGLKNKDYFLNDLPRRLQKLRAQGKPLSLLMVDIDHFKWVNDELGHPRGDEILKSTAAVLLDNIREGDLAVRYGGEEMLVAVPSDLHTAIVLAERLRYAMETSIRDREGLRDLKKLGEAHQQPCGTLSIGVADVTDVPDLAKAVDRVDKALYAAKRTRNLVVFADPARTRRQGPPFSTYEEYRLRSARGS
jgi:diguanylate cyclase (GGDEF)-like protein